jgi:DNA-binding GntR family transcriptional regulator
MATPDYSFNPSSAGVSRLVRDPLGHQIATAIARDILAGRLRAGESVSQEGLCSRFGTSRMPVRDALQALASAGYLVKGSANQLKVAHIGVEDVADTLLLESSVAGMIARRAAERATPESVAEMRELHERMCEACERGDGASMSAFNRCFHECIGAMAHSPRLVAALKAATLHVAWQYYVEAPERMAVGCAEHAQIVEAIAEGKATLAQAFMAEHVGAAQRYRVPAAPADLWRTDPKKLA